MTPTPITATKRCRITIALVRAALAINNSAEINLVVKGSRPAAAMGVVRAVMTRGEKKHGDEQCDAQPDQTAPERGIVLQV